MPSYTVEDFNKRLKRIENPRNTSYYDQELGMHIPKKVTTEAIKKQAKARSLSFKALFWSVLIGAAAVIAGQVVRVGFLGLTAPNDMALFVDILVGLFFLLTLTGALRYRKKAYQVAQIIGAAAVIFAGHNLMWYYPDQMAMIFPESYVQTVRATTEPQSIVFRDMTISL